MELFKKPVWSRKNPKIQQKISDKQVHTYIGNKNSKSTNLNNGTDFTKAD
jgi:hypothetical protein